jgi:membrane associated rhomboid family serine protease
MIPLRDVIPSRTTPFVTVGLIVINSIVYLYEFSLWLLDDRLFDIFVRHYGLVPVRFTFTAAFTSMFVHANVLHVVGNMWFLWIFGDNVEDRLGHVRFIVFYLLCGFVAIIVQAVSSPYSFLPTVGASGAIAGVMGAYFVLYPRSRVLTMIFPFIFWIIEVPAVFFLGYWFVLQLLSVGVVADTASAGGTAFWAHIAGFLTGVLMVFVFRRRERQRVEWWSDL